MRAGISGLRSRAKGLTLIELMVALALSSFLLLGLVQVFSASRTAYQLSLGLGRVQENGRFAMDFLLRDLRMAGHYGCVNDQALGLASGGGLASRLDASIYPLRFDISVQGYEATGTTPGDTIALPSVPVAGVAGDWSPALPPILANLNPVRRSDIIVLRFLEPVGTDLDAFTVAAQTTAVPVAAGASVATDFATTRSLFGFSNCRQATVAQAKSIAANGTAVFENGAGFNTSGFSATENYSGGAGTMYPATAVAYYVRNNAAGNPALYRTRWDAAPSSNMLSAQTDELVEGVESLQLLFAEDKAAVASLLPMGYVESVTHAGAIGEATSSAAIAARWRRVGQVQLGLVTRSAQPAATANAPTISLLGVTMTPPADARFRAKYESTVTLRNRMFGN